MNLQTRIKPDLWKAIAKSYESGIYSSAVLEAIHYLTDVLREKANVDGDGHSLVGQTLGGDNPLIRINKFQTQSEKNEQKGFAEILRGIYTGIRNPRSHEQFADDQPTAEAIVIFVDYILKVLDKSKGPFVLDEWLERVFDPDFVESDRYAEMIVSEVPTKRRADTLITLYREKMRDEGQKSVYIFNVLINLIGDDNLEDFLLAVSDEMKRERSDDVIVASLRILPKRLWTRVSEVARLRIEHKMLRSISSGTVKLVQMEDFVGDIVWQEYENGLLGVWTIHLGEYFSSKKELFETLLRKVLGGEQDIAYIIRYFLPYLPTLALDEEVDEVSFREAFTCKIAEGFSVQDRLMKRDLVAHFAMLPADWREELLKQLDYLKYKDVVYYQRLNPLYKPIESDENLPF